MTRTKYLLAGLAVTLLVVAGAGAALAHGQGGPATGGADADSTMPMMGGNGMMGDGGMMGSMMGGGMMGSPGEEGPYDLRFIDQMTMHHRGAIMSSGHMIADSERPELRQLAKNIEESQSEQIEQMREWREEWYGDDSGQTSGMMGSGQTDEMMGEEQMDGMMGGSMQGMMGGDMADVMFLRMMISHHQVAVEMSEEALEEAEHPELKELAQTIIDEQTTEIELMKGYLEEI